MLVAEVECLARVRDDFDGPADRHGAVVLDDVTQGDAVDVLHHDVGQRPGRGLGLAGVVDGDDRGVIQGGGVLGLPTETEIEAGVPGQVGAQHLDRDVAVQPQVACQVDLGHAAIAEDLPQLIAVREVLRSGHYGDFVPGIGSGSASGSRATILAGASAPGEAEPGLEGVSLPETVAGMLGV
ncbi:Uncharacterised protein [Mycobacteroides abscessus subsp. massiliense]|nr:Uncharacterised protein [Mycobacteroides abscessus subsp. massiliense]